ncbi:bifunctional 23S rRNA (guanine(2069)-N(7))-methyltransferase RlmK/23S rRNA (guanine(2445)-N(2))-methyltransferase RlmL [Motiliproteus sp. MSK22-1]|uniref:bifunctional 23S rRNA (guanine(2069)-N(7))-methyltransferase RlmK/23S rRNA (guanine(2445)-N(2))-methyltransferase RlmL n=1 Tax=Motiliproteus sp. MSK22-1 TaxID=1897630 RepID=UPI0009778EF2|nr:bifunctional 23S rRNA (guanine(2069)-N(7))-methyltransferase RlmK/23S rRNA (guanine(2445)-N(2))-methyltransferase RlmL [Motiliproteus sp. MSK22-1]OMH32638.1 23S rRNA (guanine(2445)-N(2))/(guanine(2069)-N(7))-methyltransferase [Motiliproteus sp. MSK22-1]
MSSNHQHSQFFATCPKGLELLLLEELQGLGAEELKSTIGGVYFSGELKTAYKACLWSRLANRILMPLNSFAVETAEQLYAGVQQVDWLQHMRSEGTLTVDFTGRTNSIKNTHFGSLKVKDAVVDQVREKTRQRPSVDKQSPDIRINVHLHKGQCQLSLDLSGDSLHRRGYRTEGGEAPLKENLAAALLYRCNWPQMAADSRPLVDPMCGSGTLLIEAGLMAAGIAPGVFRRRFGFENWLKHDSLSWQELVREARATRNNLAKKTTKSDSDNPWSQQQDSVEAKAINLPEIHGYDASPKAVSITRENIRRAGLEGYVRVSQRELADLKPLTHKADQLPGLLLTNPPYGERLSEVPVIVYLYRHLGEALKKYFLHWKVGVFTGNPELGKAVAIRSNKQYKLYNGAIPSKLLMFDVEKEHFFRDENKGAETTADNQPKGSPSTSKAQSKTTIETTFTGSAEMFANRLRKNLKQIDKWARKADIHCYRVYDADMPEFSVAIDRYDQWVHVQEYTAPASVDQVKAVERLEQVISVIPSVMQVDPDRVVLKQRRRQSGKDQYQQLDEQKDFVEVSEGNCRFLVNFHDYLDTGLFLDHRPIRQKIHHWAKGKRFLNLFCYTGAATIHAALGLARSTTSVDMSNTYLEWLRKNLALNGLSEQLHQTVQADCLEWLKAQGQESPQSYDLIFMDPPTFSNSKRMRDTLDIQRDHVELIRLALVLLAPEGQLIFSNNLRKFKMDLESLSDLTIKDITRETIDKDFARNQKIHNCWLIENNGGKNSGYEG